EPRREAKYKLASADKEKEVRVVILASAGLETRPELLRVEREIGHALAQKLQEGFKANSEKVVLVPSSRVEKYKDDHPGWNSMAPDEIGKYFRADYVINLEIKDITLYENGSANQLFRGRAAIAVDVVDVHKSSEGPVYQEEYTTVYPKVRDAIPAG